MKCSTIIERAAESRLVELVAFPADHYKTT
jgi:hypothetical protein